MQTFTGIQYLQIDIANGFGLDKEDWNVRLDWFEQNKHQLDALLSQAEEPALYYSAVKAYRDVMAGKPTGHLISLDATSSGLQILACLTGDRLAAQHCNVVDTGHRQDAYTNLYQVMMKWLASRGCISRHDTKNAIMTAFYGSDAEPKRVFGEGEQLEVFFYTMETETPGAWELNKAMKAIWNSDALSHDWVMPDNFHVHTKVMDTVTETVHVEGMPFEVSYKVNQPMEEGRELCANMTHSIDAMIVREVTRRCDYDEIQVARLHELLDDYSSCYNRRRTEDDKLVGALWRAYKDSGYLSARILDHLNADNLGHVDPAVILNMLHELPDRPFKVLSVHDCFRCLPHYGNDLRRQYNIQLANIASSNLLEYLVSQIIKRPVQISKLDHTLPQDILQTNYALS